MDPVSGKVKIEGPFTIIENDGVLCLAASVGSDGKRSQWVILSAQDQHGKATLMPAQVQDLLETFNAGWEARSALGMAAH